MAGHVFRSLKTVIAAAMALAALNVAPADAALIAADDAVYGSGSLTRDTDTGLEWLDVPLTQGLSIGDVLGGAGGYVANGFGVATSDQLNTLWTNAGFVVLLSSTANRPAGELVIDRMGCTFVSDPLDDCMAPFNGQTVYGQAGAVRVEGAATLLLASVGLEGPGSPLVAVAGFPGELFLDTRDDRWGVYLVRQSAVQTPVAGTLPLLLTSISGVWLVRRRSSRRPRAAARKAD